MVLRLVAGTVVAGLGALLGSGTAAAQVHVGDPTQVQVGGAKQPVEVSVDASPSKPQVKARVHVRVGGLEVGPAQADVSPRIARPGSDPSSSTTQQTSGGQASGGQGAQGSPQAQVAPANVQAHPRVLSPGDDGDHKQDNSSPAAHRVGSVNADVSPRLFSDGSTGPHTQHNGSSDAEHHDPGQDDPFKLPQAPPVPLVGSLVETLRPSRGRRGAIDLVAVNADISPRVASDGNDGARVQWNGQRGGARGGSDDLGADDQLLPVNAIVAPRVLSDGDNGPVAQHNGSVDREVASATNAGATTGAGDQVLTDDQLVPVNAAVLIRVLSDGNDDSVSQHNGSDDDQQAGVTNTGGAAGDASTGSGDQVLADDQLLPVNALAGGDVLSDGDSGDVSQHNGSDDDQLATADNGVGSSGGASTGSGDETLTDAQALPLNLAAAPDVLSSGDDGSLSQHNGSDDDQEVRVTNAGQSGGDGQAGAGDQTLTDAQLVPLDLAAGPDVLSAGDDGPVTQHNGSDDDQKVTVINGPGAANDGTTGAGDQTLTDGQLVPVTGAVDPDLGGSGDDGPVTQHNGSDDDQEVLVVNAGQAGGDGAAGAGDQTLSDGQVLPVAGDVSPPIGSTGTVAPPTQHNGSDDDQKVTVINGPGAGGTGSGGTGDQTGSDTGIVPIGVSTQPGTTQNTATDDVEVLVTSTPAPGGVLDVSRSGGEEPAAGGGGPGGGTSPERSGGGVRKARSRFASTPASDDGTTTSDETGGEALPRTGLPVGGLGGLGVLLLGSGLALRRRREDEEEADERTPAGVA